MHKKNTVASAALAACLLPSTGLAADLLQDPIIVTATRTELPDTEAPYASETYSRRDIEASRAATLYDYLDRHTSVAVMPSYGSTATQLIDMRGYGINDGYQNIVVTIDGRRLNNIDLNAPMLKTIPLNSIERIEITKGSGSVLYGDGATAGAIHIKTRDLTELSLTAASGSHGDQSLSIGAGLAGEYAALSATAEVSEHDGLRDADATGHRDDMESDQYRALLRLFPADALELRLGKESSSIDTRLGAPLTLEQFEANPAQSGDAVYTFQKLRSDVSTFGFTAGPSSDLQLVYDYHEEDKSSHSRGTAWGMPWEFKRDYDYRSHDIAVQYQLGALGLTTGWQRFDGVVQTGDDETEKENAGWYLQAQYRGDQTTYSAGARKERVTYTHRPAAGSTLDDKHDLTAYDIGANRRITEQLSLFANYNYAYQAPDIDRFFTTDFFTGITSFNAFIVPARSRTVNLGLNHTTANNRLKVTLFRAELKNEIYFDPLTFSNTNIDESHKYGLEVQDRFRFNRQFGGSLNYTYTRATIDQADRADGAFDGKRLPGVSPHALTLALDYAPTPEGRLTLSQTWRSKAYAINDFGNDFDQRQAAYRSTGIGYNHRVGPVELFATVDNLFDKANGLWVADDAIYPVNFERTWRIGLRAAI